MSTTRNTVTADLREHIGQCRRQLSYLARNMSDSFDGELDAEEANAYNALAQLLGLLLTLEDDADLIDIRATGTAQQSEVRQ